MKNRLLPSLGVFASVIGAFALGVAAKDGSDARSGSALPMPVLRKDPTPVAAGQGGPVTSYADVLEPVEKAVVSIYSTKLVHERVPVNPLLKQFFPDQVPDLERESKQEGLGSGVIVSADGYILTNNHVVEGADELTVSLSDERKFKAKVIGADQKTDVAVVKIEASGLPMVTIADSDRLRVGDIVFAVGNPLGVGETVTMGIVSAKGRNQLGLLDDVAGYENFIQTDAAINMGNSGGALTDAKGRLVGINSAIISPSRGNIGIGFAIPVNLAAGIMQSLIETGTVNRGFLGVGTQTMTADIADQLGLPKDARGAIVTDITAGGPAEKAGLKSSDVILAINDKPVVSTEDLRLMIAEMPPGSKASLKTIRNGKPSTVLVTLGKLSEKPNELFPGVTVSKLTDELRRKLGVDSRVGGLVITAVDPGSAFADQLAPDMVIMEVNRSPVSDATAARALLQPGRNLLLVYFRGAFRFFSVTVK